MHEIKPRHERAAGVSSGRAAISHNIAISRRLKAATAFRAPEQGTKTQMRAVRPTNQRGTITRSSASIAATLRVAGAMESVFHFTGDA
jgi:hypothetical protein